MSDTKKTFVQLVTIKVIPDRLHGVCQLQQSLNECLCDSLTAQVAK
jgi:hypothetical protein